MNYNYADREVRHIESLLIGSFFRLKGLVSFDELNILQSVNSLYSKADGIIRQGLLRIARQAYRAAAKEEQRSIDFGWLSLLLMGYDPVSKYVFDNELDRKRSRLIEAMIASRDKPGEVSAALRGVSLMVRIYAIRVADEATLQAYKDCGVEYVRWVAEKDGKTCPCCRERSGKVYRISELPPKPHPHCRCRYERVGNE